MTGEQLQKLRKSRGLTQDELALATGIPKGTIGRMEFNKDQLVKKVDVLNALEHYFNNESEVDEKDKQVDQENLVSGNKVPMYNIPASASSVEMYNDPNDVKIIGYLSVPGATKTSFALPVYGHSMSPTLESGAWGILRPIEDSNDILWGEIYYIEWGDYRNYKRLLLGENADEVILWSDNQNEVVNGRPKYSPVTIKRDRIRKLCLLTDILMKPNY